MNVWSPLYSHLLALQLLCVKLCIEEFLKPILLSLTNAIANSQEAWSRTWLKKVGMSSKSKTLAQYVFFRIQFKIVLRNYFIGRSKSQLSFPIIRSSIVLLARPQLPTKNRLQMTVISREPINPKWWALVLYSLSGQFGFIVQFWGGIG